MHVDTFAWMRSVDRVKHIDNGPWNLIIKAFLTIYLWGDAICAARVRVS